MLTDWSSWKNAIFLFYINRFVKFVKMTVHASVVRALDSVINNENSIYNIFPPKFWHSIDHHQQKVLDIFQNEKRIPGQHSKIFNKCYLQSVSHPPDLKNTTFFEKKKIAMWCLITTRFQSNSLTSYGCNGKRLEHAVFVPFENFVLTSCLFDRCQTKQDNGKQ